MHIYPIRRYIKQMNRVLVVTFALFANTACDIAPQGVRFRPPQAIPSQTCADTTCTETTSEKEH
jgi:uncharacterized lipoprotein YajG